MCIVALTIRIHECNTLKFPKYLVVILGYWAILGASEGTEKESLVGRGAGKPARRSRSAGLRPGRAPLGGGLRLDLTQKLFA